VIDSEAKKQNRQVKCLLQFYIAEEDTKFGLTLTEARGNFEIALILNYLNNICICRSNGNGNIHRKYRDKSGTEFKLLKTIFKTLKNEYFSERKKFLLKFRWECPMITKLRSKKEVH
jgi:PLP dependent protein